MNISKINCMNQFSVILVIVSACTAVGAWLWLVDPSTSRVSRLQWCHESQNTIFTEFFFLQEPFLSSLWQHPFFTLSSFVLILLFFGGIHKRVVAPSM